MCFAEWKRELLHSILFCFVFFSFFNELRWNNTHIHQEQIYLKMKKKINFSSSNGFGWSQSYSEARQSSTKRHKRQMKHSTEKQKVTGKRNQRTLIEASQLMCIHLEISVSIKFGDANFVQIVLLWFYGCGILFCLLYIFRKINFLWHRKMLPKRTKNCFLSLQTYWILS